MWVLMFNASGFPKISMPLVDDKGNITQPWRKLFELLWTRSGQPGQGGSESQLLDTQLLSHFASLTSEVENLHNEVSQIYPLQSLVASGGLTGAQGKQGFPGVPGVDGENGEQGQQGPSGAIGATGIAGLLGPPGFDGEDGEQGGQGIQGLMGFTGATGAQGIQGFQGPPAYDGEDGEIGLQGPPGRDASGCGATTPTTMQANLMISDYTQMLYRQHIIVGSRSIILGTDASLIGV